MTEERAILAGGCFWRVRSGVVATISGHERASEG